MEPAIENLAVNANGIQNGQVLSLPEILAILSLGDTSGEEEKCPIWLP